AEALARSTEQRVAIVLRTLREEIRGLEQRLEAVQLLCRQDIGEFRQEFLTFRDAVDPSQLRQHLLQSMEARLSQIEYQLTELARSVLQISQEQRTTVPNEDEPRWVDQVFVNEHKLQELWQRLLTIEKRMSVFPLLLGILAVGVVVAMLMGLWRG
ncbi:MAG: hypothetical protein NZ949_08195, partial [Candidatus Kapabacteria bacterium]|nr:hypothetical protein [Candidatus Kapabacteria bacterium]MDW7997659.1 hypothetical protein [Bacteroidota bacterium]